MHLRDAAVSAIAILSSVTAPGAMAQSAPPSWRTPIQEAVTNNPALEAIAPSDVGAFCPTFSTLDAAGRALFWTTFLTELARAESAGDPSRTRWLPFDRVMQRPTFRRGLFQISIEAAHSARYQCDVSNAAALADVGTNAACAVKILAEEIGTSGAISDAGHYWPTLGRGRRRRSLAKNVATQAPCDA